MQKKDKSFQIFNQLLESPQNSLVQEAADAGRIPIAYTCSFVPEALLMADRLFPVRLTAPGVAGTEIADNYLSCMLCSYTRSIFEYTLDDCYDLIRGWVFVPSCMQMPRVYDNLNYLKKPAFNHIIDVPRKINDATVGWLTEELGILAEKLQNTFGVDMSDTSLRKSIDDWNHFAGAIQALGLLRKKNTPPLSGSDFHSVVMAGLTSPKDLILPHIETLYRKLENQEGTGKYRARLMVVGGHLQDPEFIKIIESQGGLVVADRFCTGSIPGISPVILNGNPLRSLAEHCFAKTLCPRMMDSFDRRLETIIETVKEYQVDGVVLEILKFCDLWGVEAMPLVSALRNEGIPVLKLEREYRTSGEGQLRTRVQAFIESLGK